MARPIATLLLASSVLGTGAQAFTRFDSTCTIPTTHVSFVSSPDSRGTLDILWSCLFTIIACTWTIQHLNIPEQRDRASEKKDRLHQIWYAAERGAKSFWSNLKWMLFTMVAPEFILGKAIGDFMVAWDLKKKVDEMKRRGEVEFHEEWGLSHGFFALMGGFRVLLRDDSQEKKETQRRENTPTGEKQGDKLERASIAVLDDSEIQGSRTKEGENIRDQTPQTSLEWDLPGIEGSGILPPETLLWLREHRQISRLPNITKEEIHDKSKANFFIKALAVVQVLWVCIQIIVRNARGLAISQLELVVTAFSVCTIITYIFLIPKPQGVQVPMRPILIRPEIFSTAPHTDWISLRSLIIPGLIHTTTFTTWNAMKVPNVMVVPNDSVPGREHNHGIYTLGMSVGAIIFGAIHVAGWNLEFPTPIEQELWRIASVIMTCLLPVTLLPYTLITIGMWWLSGNPLQLWGFAFGAIYIIARLFVLVEAFRTLGFLPPDAFVATWVSNIPSVS